MSNSQSITLRIPVADLKTARILAASKGLPYQTFIKMLLHEALNREGREPGESRWTDQSEA